MQIQIVLAPQCHSNAQILTFLCKSSRCHEASSKWFFAFIRNRPCLGENAVLKLVQVCNWEFKRLVFLLYRWLSRTLQWVIKNQIKTISLLSTLWSDMNRTVNGNSKLNFANITEDHSTKLIVIYRWPIATISSYSEQEHFQVKQRSKYFSTIVMLPDTSIVAP